MKKRIFSAMMAAVLAAGMAGCTLQPKGTAARKSVKVIETAVDDGFDDDIRAWRRANGTEKPPVRKASEPEATPESTAAPDQSADASGQTVSEGASAQSAAPAPSQPTQSYASNGGGQSNYAAPTYEAPQSNADPEPAQAQEDTYTEPAPQDEAPAPAPVEEQPAAPADPTFPYTGSLGSLTLSNGYSVALDYYCQAAVDDPYDAAYDPGSMFGCEYVCDHARRKPDALAGTENSDTMWIKDEYGNVRTLHKLGSRYCDDWTLQLTDDRGNVTGEGVCFNANTMNSYGAVLIFQTCALDAPADGLNLITYWG